MFLVNYIYDLNRQINGYKYTISALVDIHMAQLKYFKFMNFDFIDRKNETNVACHYKHHCI